MVEATVIEISDAFGSKLGYPEGCVRRFTSGLDGPPHVLSRPVAVLIIEDDPNTSPVGGAIGWVLEVALVLNTLHRPAVDVICLV